MSKKDIPLLIALVALWIAWPTLDRKVFRKFFKEPPPAPAVAATPATPASEPGAGDAGPPAAITSAAEISAPSTAPVAPEPPPASQVPERTAVLENKVLRITLSSRGATIRETILKAFPSHVAPDSEPVHLDFSAAPALAISGAAGLTAESDFQMEADAAGRQVRFERRTGEGLMYRRVVHLDEGYMLRITDELVNPSASALSLPAYGVQVGAMENLASESHAKGIQYLGLDALLVGGEGVEHWGSRLPKWFEKEGPHQVEKLIGKSADWIAAKNKFFVQILTPSDGVENISAQVVRDPATGLLRRVWMSGLFPALTLPPEGSFARDYTYYIGPKKYTELRKLGRYQADIMEFFLPMIGKYLLLVMNFLHDHLWPHNYGLAIMLLTILVRVLFWPLTHKGTENMKRMAELQPLMTEIRQKYKDNAPKQQQEMMKLYKEHKVNPMMGCLPMLVQIPVFIALFYVLRSAIELRFANFLWVKDLSEPEHLFMEALHFPLNILPLLMAATTMWQQKLTPSTADPSQQKIMMFMPLMMLVFLYNFASGLVLYWTTNNCIMIVQQLLQKRKREAAKAKA